MNETVVVGYDDSAESAAAVRWAAAEAVRFGAPLEVVHVWGFAGEPHGGAGTSRLGEQVLAAVQGVADAGADIARETTPGVEVSAVVRHGSVAEALVDLSQDALLVVVGRRGSGRVPGGLLGSVAHAVLHLAHCPVVVVPAVDAGSTPGVGSDEVVAGFDGSAGAYQALDAAAAAARVRGRGVRVLTAWSPASETRSMTYWTVAYPDASPGEVALGRAEHAQAEAREPEQCEARVHETGPERRTASRRPRTWRELTRVAAAASARHPFLSRPGKPGRPAQPRAAFATPCGRCSDTSERGRAVRGRSARPRRGFGGVHRERNGGRRMP